MTFTWAHALYRFYDADGRLLYVGITNSIQDRFSQHARQKRWWPEVADCRVVFYQDRATLRKAEAAAIRGERPAYNFQYAVAPDFFAPDEPARPARKRPLRQRLTDDEWDWLHSS